MVSMWELGGLTWKDLGKRVWTGINDDDVLGRSAQLAYFFLLALFPLLLFLTTLLGFLTRVGSDIRASLFIYLGQVMPASATVLVRSTIEGVSAGAGGGKLSFGILAALWAASNGMGAITDALNSAYHVKETRYWWQRRLIAIGLTIALSVLIVSALTLLLFGGRIAETLASTYRLGSAFALTWKIVQWPIVLAFVLVSFSLIYFFAPNVRQQEWKWAAPGTVIGVFLWLLVSFGFRVYLHFFNSYSATYGSLGAVIVLMLWFYLTGVAILIGGEINSEIDAAAATRRGLRSP
jgi:membrane protein